MNLEIPINYTIINGPVNVSKQIKEIKQKSPLKIVIESKHENKEIANNVYITVVTLLNNLNDLMEAPPQKWVNDKPLIIFPFAGKNLNAFYNRKSLLFGYKDDFYTANCSDIVAHELGHAFLDALRPDLWNASSMEIWAFHEAFADSIAMLSILQHQEAITNILMTTKGDLTINNIASDIATSFGELKFNKPFLRSGINENKYINSQHKREPHQLSNVFFGAIYDIFLTIYNEKKQQFHDRLAVQEARNILAFYLTKAAQNAPINVKFFESVAKTILWADAQLGKPYHDKIYDIFLKRNIFSNQVKTQSFQENKKIIKPGLLTIENKINYFNNIELDFINTEVYVYDLDNNLIDSLVVSSEETKACIDEFFSYIKNTDEFEINNKTLQRNIISCCGGCRDPLKTSPEYGKKYKPENNFGCCGGSKKPKETPKKKIKLGCFIRYKT